jgi:adenylylsulfate kinase
MVNPCSAATAVSVSIMRTPGVLWFTGLSGAGKSTLARRLREDLLTGGNSVELLDGDEIRTVLPHTGFSRAERDAHVRTVGYMASRLEYHGIIVLASLISPYRDSRDFVRGLCRNFVEIYVATSLEECERRDAKGLYARARRGEVLQFTGIDDPYEPPLRPNLVIDTGSVMVEDAVAEVLSFLRERGNAASA